MRRKKNPIKKGGLRVLGGVTGGRRLEPWKMGGTHYCIFGGGLDCEIFLKKGGKLRRGKGQFAESCQNQRWTGTGGQSDRNSKPCWNMGLLTGGPKTKKTPQKKKKKKRGVGEGGGWGHSCRAKDSEKQNVMLRGRLRKQDWKRRKGLLKGRGGEKSKKKREELGGGEERKKPLLGIIFVGKRGLGLFSIRGG